MSPWLVVCWLTLVVCWLTALLGRKRSAAFALRVDIKAYDLLHSQLHASLQFRPGNDGCEVCRLPPGLPVPVTVVQMWLSRSARLGIPAVPYVGETGVVRSS